ncbi:hypothetical protein [Micromonospora globbae]|uniref:Uncharacterized protein n=1 Tax=Micromonospora globbae TaxID=1894969 RepID=A0ABZ1S5M0_9ACTN|nr:hypothetical protein [Micromonospora globbae]
MASVAGRGATRSGHPPLERAVLQGFYRRMRAVAPAAVGAIERDRAGDPASPFADTACGRLVRSLDHDGLRALGMWAHHWCMRFYDDDTRAGLRLVREIAARTGLGWTADEVRWMLRESRAAGPAAPARFLLPAAAARELSPDALPPAELPPHEPAPDLAGEPAAVDRPPLTALVPRQRRG